MKCIDAIEGTVKCIIKGLHSTQCNRDNLDDSEYILNIRTVIDAAIEYVRQHPEFIDDPDVLNRVLYTYSRDLWLAAHYPTASNPQCKTTILDEENEEYQTYYYDYIYYRGMYPG